MKPRHVGRDPLLLELVAAIGAGNIEIGPLHDDAEFTHGIARGDGSIRIFEGLNTVETAIHECVHRVRPEWSERAVRAKTTRIMRQLSHREIDKIYELILSVSAVKHKAEYV